jgi:hypothetical protein
MPKHREKVAGVEIAKKLLKLKGRSEAMLARDDKRGATSPLGVKKKGKR